MANYKHTQKNVDNWLGPNPLIKNNNGNGNGDGNGDEKKRMRFYSGSSETGGSGP
mgnify:CR=1 FL=1